MFYKLSKDVKKKQMIIVWETKTTYIKNILGWIGIIACFTNHLIVGAISLLLLAGYLAYYLHVCGDILYKLRILENNNYLSYYGNKYSFKNPLTVVVPLVRFQA